MGMNTPWGRADQVSTLAEGIIQVSTPSHGGIKLSPDRNAEVHEAWRSADGWYEEDCEAYIPSITFPAEFAIHYPNWTVEQDHAALKSWMPDEYEKVYGVKVTAAESHVVAEREFYAAHVDDWVVTSASGSWHDNVPDGMVGVVAQVGGRGKPDGERAWFLVPELEYDQRNGHGFVVDPARHQRVTNDFTRVGFAS